MSGTVQTWLFFPVVLSLGAVAACAEGPSASISADHLTEADARALGLDAQEIDGVVKFGWQDIEPSLLEVSECSETCRASLDDYCVSPSRADMVVAWSTRRFDLESLAPTQMLYGHCVPGWDATGGRISGETQVEGVCAAGDPLIDGQSYVVAAYGERCDSSGPDADCSMLWACRYFTMDGGKAVSLGAASGSLY